MSSHDEFLKRFRDKFGDDEESSLQRSKQPSINSQSSHKKHNNNKPTPILNPFFKNIQISSQQTQIQHQQLSLIIKQKPTPTTSHLNDKIKCNRNRRNHPTTQNHQLQSQMLKKIQDINNCEHLQIQIQIPKLIRGNNYNANATLYLKNIPQNTASQHPNSISVSKPKDNLDTKNNPKINRSQLFTQINQKIKKRKSIAVQHVKESFKNTTLNDLQTHINTKKQKQQNRKINTIQINKTIEQGDINTNQSKLSSKNDESNQSINQTTLKSIAQDQTHKIQQIEQNKLNNSKITIVEQDDNQLDEESQKIFNKLTKVAKRIKQRKQIKNKNKNKTKNKNISQRANQIRSLFEEQAQASDIQGTHSQDQSEQQYQGVSLTSKMADWIDNKQYLSKNDIKQGRKKFIQDQIMRDAQIIQRIKSGLIGKKQKSKQQSISQKKRRQRIQEAANKIQKQDQLFLGQKIQSLQNKNQQSKQSEDSSKQNQSKIKILEQELGIQKPNNFFMEPKKKQSVILPLAHLQTFTFVKPTVNKKRKGLLGGQIGSVVGKKIQNNYKSKVGKSYNLFKNKFNGDLLNDKNQ